MKLWITAACLVLVVTSLSLKTVEAGSTPSVETTMNAETQTIPPGTTITAQNWQQYQEFMPDGMIALFQGKYYWKMPADVSMEVGPTVIYPLPPNYVAATEKYSGQVRIVELPHGGLNLTGYQGGIPFPKPQDPQKGWKILANLWFRYIPHISVNTYSQGCYVNSFSNFSCDAGTLVYRQLSYNTDPGVPSTISGSQGKFFTEYFEATEPEQERYNANLKIGYTDLTRPEDGYNFIPAYRRYQPESSLARCAPVFGSDTTPEDFRAGYDSNITEVKVDFLGEKKILNLQDFKIPAQGYPHDFDLPLGWPEPSWGKWQVRDAYVISVSKVPQLAHGYCYGKRVMYIDKQFYGALWEDLYDSHDQPWKFLAIFRPAHQAPGIGPVNEALSYEESIWDIQNKHATFFLDPIGSKPTFVNQETPGEYQDVERYTTPSGLNMIMR